MKKAADIGTQLVGQRKIRDVLILNVLATLLAFNPND
jgi:hypothetical protein